MSDQQMHNNDLDSYLQGDSELSQVYHQASDSKSPQSADELILSEARKNIQQKTGYATSPFSSNWAVPVSLAAILVITIAIVPILYDDILSPDHIADDTVLLDSAKRDQVKQTATIKTREPQPAKFAEHKKKAETVTTTPKRMKTPPSTPATAIKPSTAPDSRVSKQRQRETEAFSPASQGLPAPAQDMEIRQLGRPAELTVEQGRTMEPEAHTNEQTSLEKRTPELWLNAIKVLLQQGKDKQAVLELEQFRKLYPEYPVDTVLDDAFK